MQLKSIPAPVAVRSSRPGVGSGLFAAAAIRKGRFILEYTGKRIPTSLADTLKTRYLFELDSTWTLDAEDERNTARYVNHACDPNAEARIENSRIFIFAARDIARGEEITIDYGEEYFNEFIRPIGCKCRRCSSRITGGRLRARS